MVSAFWLSWPPDTRIVNTRLLCEPRKRRQKIQPERSESRLEANLWEEIQYGDDFPVAAQENLKINIVKDVLGE